MTTLKLKNIIFGALALSGILALFASLFQATEAQSNTESQQLSSELFAATQDGAQCSVPFERGAGAVYNLEDSGFYGGCGGLL